MSRDAAEFSEASYFDDPSSGCDSLEDHIKELVMPKLKKGVTPEKANALLAMVSDVVRKILDEGRASALVDVQKLSGRELMARLIAEIIDSPQPRLMARCIDFVFMLGVQPGMNETDIGKAEDITKASASRCCVYLKNAYLAGTPAPGMKSNTAVESYRHIRTGRTSRTPAGKWAFGEVLKSHFQRKI